MKKILAASCALLLLFSLAGCSGTKYEPLSANFDKDKVVAAAQQAVTYMSTGDYQKVSDMARDDIKDKLSVDVLQSAVEKVMPKAGAFVSFGDATTASYKDPKTEEYALVVVPAKYENQTVTYTISLNTDLKIVGFFLK